MTDLRDLLARLRHAASASKELRYSASDLITEAADTIESLQARVAELREALAPFASFALPLQEEDRAAFAQAPYSSAKVTYGDFRRARTVLGGEDGTD